MKIKIICNTPKGKAEESSKNFGVKYFFALKKAIETTIVSDSQFYYVYEMTEKEYGKLQSKKVPKAENSIRTFYTLLIHIVERANKLGAKGALKIEKMKAWILKRMKKQGYNEKGLDDFIDAIDISDKEELLTFLAGDLFILEVLEE